MELIIANHATSVANHTAAMESMVANQVAMMAAIAALGDAEHVCRSFAFQSHIKVVRAANSCVRDLQSSIVPMPLAPVEPLLPGVFDFYPPDWPAAGYSISDQLRLTHVEAEALIEMYALGLQGALLPHKSIFRILGNALLKQFNSFLRMKLFVSASSTRDFDTSIPN
jgi:hypothetical protein